MAQVKMNPKKVEAITNFPYPTNLRELRSLLGLFNFYRRFIKGFAEIAKPLTNMLRGDNGKVKKSESKTIKIFLSNTEKEAIDSLKNAIISPEIILSYPNFKKDFHLTTDASNRAIRKISERI